MSPARRGPAFRRAGLLAGALALGGQLPPPPGAQAPALPDSAALLRTVRVLAADSMEGRRAGTPGAARARRYLVDRFKALGLRPLGAGFEHPFPLSNGAATGVNLLALIPGTASAGRYLVLSAHYDHLGMRGGEVYNGADDNASGTAAVLALAAALRNQPPLHSVIIALFDAEESGLLGARAFLANLPSPVARAALALNVNLDMVGHSENGELWAAGARHSPALAPVLQAVAARAPVRLRLGHDGAGPGKDWTGDSDHAVFHQAGIPFVYFGVEDHKDYHRPTDDPETLTPAFFAGAVKTMLEAVRALDGAVK